MNSQMFYRAICLCAFLVAPVSNASTVWSFGLNEPTANSSWTAYVVTVEDQIQQTMTATSMYLYNLETGSPSFDPTLLLTNSPEDLYLANPNEYDMYDNGPIGTIELLPFSIVEWIVVDFTAEYAQPQPFDFLSIMLCSGTSLDFGLCDFIDGFGDPLAGNALTMEYGPGLTFVASTVPVPATVWLFGSGLLGMIGIARRKNAA